jgi:hypothetical protein
MSIQDALDYARGGWAVFPLLPKSKAPACAHGFHDATTSDAEIKTLWGNRTNFNIGIATGEVSGFWVLDIDMDKGGRESLEAWENKYGSLPTTLTSKTGGGGKHLFFKLPKGMKIPSNSNKLAAGIDLRGEGGYIAAPPSVHPNGTTYEWEAPFEDIAEAPAWLIKLIFAVKKDTTPAVTSPVDSDWTTEDVLSMLDCVSPEDREIWVQVGMALSDGGWPVTLWDTWSRGSPKYKMGEPFRLWSGFKAGSGISMGTLVHLAQTCGWVPKDTPKEALDFSNISGVDLRDFRDSINAAIKEPEVKTAIAIGGLIGDTVSWINSTSQQPQPELAVMNTIAALGAVFGRRYALQQHDTRTNIYMVGIAETGQGKSDSKKCISKLLRLSGLEDFYGPESVRSGPGLLLELKKQPSFLASIDEIGMFMKSLFDQKAQPYIKEISSLFTELYSKSDTFYKGGVIASQPDARLVLNEPNLCIYGTTTLSSYAEAMKKSVIASGEINRYIVLKCSVDFPDLDLKADRTAPPPDTLITRWAKFKPDGLAAAPDIIEQKKTTVMLGGMIDAVNDLLIFQKAMEKEYRGAGMNALWVRYRENVLKVAMIIAIARDCAKPVLNASDLEFGKALVGSSIRFMMKFAKDNMYDSDFQKKCSEFMAALDKGITTRAKMNSYLRIKPKELDEIERALLEMDKIEFDAKERPRKYMLK